MAKMRVHELAKELEIKSQDVIDVLKGTQFEVKSANSGLEEEAIAMVKQSKGKASAKPADKPVEKPAEKSADKPAEKPAEKPADKSAEKPAAKPAEKPAEGDRPKKKSSITAVFNAQYSKQGRRPGNGQQKPDRDRRNEKGNDRGGNGNRRENGAPRQEQHSIIRPRPVGERAMRPISERTQNVAQEPMTENKAPKQPVHAEAPERQEKTANRPQQQIRRPVVERNIFANAGNEERKPSERGERNNDRGNRGERNNFRGDRSNDRNSDRNNNRGDRNNGDRNNGDRNNQFRGSRNDRSNNRFQSEAVVPADDVRGKESRERGNNRGNNGNRRQDHDKLGGKRQENFINLEKHGGKKKPQQPQQPKEDPNEIKTITIPEKIVIRDLADKMKVQPSAIVKKLFMKGQMVTVNHEVDFETAEEIALEFNFICEAEEKVDVIAELLKEEEENTEEMITRAPVVCVMGHVDHGKTSLLDAIRSTRVTDREAGGITQHIGASVVSINDQNITFLDTPGHEAFTAMRMRGAKSTDIAILVVAADDGVMPQTVEAINHARAAEVEIIVAINKIDKPSANIDKVKQELSEYELIPEDWGGSTVFCPVSAHTGEGIENLLEMILLTAEVLELKANPNRKARGLVIEAQLDKGRGSVATVLVQKGTLHVGDPIACGSCYGKVRAMVDDKGRRVKEAGPSTPVEILGLNSVPEAGETFVCTESDKEAKAFADTYISEGKNKLIEETKAKMSLDDLFSQIQSGNMKELDIIVKADVQGSVEAVKQSLEKLSNEEVMVKVIHGGVGAINDSDVILASASNAIIIGFNVRPDPVAKVTAEREGVDVRLYRVIYNAIEDVEAAMKGMLDPVFEEQVIGHAEIRQIFKASGVGNIAGSYILDGKFERGCSVRITRAGELLFEGPLASLKRFKDDVKEVKAGYECGLVFEGFGDIEELDIVEAYKMVEVPR